MGGTQRGSFVDTHGTARFATLDDLKTDKANDWLGAKGMLLGEIDGPRGMLQRTPTHHELRQADDTHHFVVAGNGGGKFVSSLGVLLYDLMRVNPGSCVVVVDPKGEALEKVGKLGVRPFSDAACPSRYDVRWLDPFDVTRTRRTWSINPLRALTPDNPFAVEEAKILANAIISIGSKDSHWDESARNFLRALILYVAQDPAEDGNGRDLVRVRQIAASGWEQDNIALLSLKRVCEAMAEWDLPMADGSDGRATAAIRNGARTLMSMHHEARESVLSGLYRDTEWLDCAFRGR